MDIYTFLKALLCLPIYPYIWVDDNTAKQLCLYLPIWIYCYPFIPIPVYPLMWIYVYFINSYLII